MSSRPSGPPPPASGAPGPGQAVPPFRRFNTAAWVTLVVGALGFFVHITSESSTVTNGVVTDCSYIDVGQFLVAFVGLAAAAVCIRSRRGTDPETSRVLLIAGLVGFLLADIHLIWGITGVAGATGPCS